MLSSLGVVAALLVTPVVPADSLEDMSLRDSIAHFASTLGPLSGTPGVILADMGGDAAPEAVASIWIDDNLPGGATEGASNPANAYSVVVVFAQTGGAWRSVGYKHLGQGEVKGVAKGVITVESVTYATDDPLCCPSLKKTLHLGLRRGKLADLAQPASRARRKGGK